MGKTTLGEAPGGLGSAADASKKGAPMLVFQDSQGLRQKIGGKQVLFIWYNFLLTRPIISVILDTCWCVYTNQSKIRRWK
jgi:hypothetical protein